MNKVITLKERPSGKPDEKNFELKKEEKPALEDGEILLESKYISVDPYLRGRMRDEDSYITPFKLNEPLSSMVVAKIVESKNDEFQEGDHVSGMLQWKQFQKHTGEDLNKITNKKVPLSAYLGILGLTGLTAYLALKNIGKLKEGETLLVSGAAGAVGSVVGQIGKIKGCRVVGIAGTDEKIDHIKSDFGFDAGINYKTTEDMAKAIKEHCPDGVDVYFDNVGGEILDAAMQNINDFARIINCGAISIYNKEEVPKGMRLEGIMVKKRALMQGFIVRDHADEFQEAIKQLGSWLADDKLKFDETRREGFENVPKAFIEIFEGKNTGKMLVEV
ncbi:NADP-dependent oxidoreductase [Zunongwangia profunda]|uniref:Zinc-type alcohol dehydrogenase n=2 Tax=Zunongwangia profunda TaxID=398743 RepID=D5BF45_ZUNPS|nr:NADP-dependent oxidoreductase [Zunongwangia profunda]ADF52943.1 zinc-type alcohol dehydrogenase [Zunongwangia profunda SM-A87]MAS72797.1 NADP-dependent oxidoreductase [Zunongwangia sp.]|tara:strand:+ start:279 stop:1274 length:996 start_codon:yes stop_codon:yes gene_type:complete